LAWRRDKKRRGAFHTRRNRGQLRGSCKAVPYYNTNTLKGGLQLAATMRTTREGPQHRDPQGGSSEGTHRGDGKRPGRRPLQKAGGSRGSGRYTKRKATQQAVVTETGWLSRRPLQRAGGRYRRPLQEASGRYRRPLQEQCPGAGCPNKLGTTASAPIAPVLKNNASHHHRKRKKAPGSLPVKVKTNRCHAFDLDLVFVLWDAGHEEATLHATRHCSPLEAPKTRLPSSVQYSKNFEPR
jgi:hypothetical protein